MEGYQDIVKRRATENAEESHGLKRLDTRRHEGTSLPSLAFDQNGAGHVQPWGHLGVDHGALFELIDDRMGTHVG